MLIFWVFTIYIFYYGFTEGDPEKLTLVYDDDSIPCGSEIHGTLDYKFAYFYQPLIDFGSIICVKKCP